MQTTYVNGIKNKQITNLKNIKLSDYQPQGLGERKLNNLSFMKSQSINQKQQKFSSENNKYYVEFPQQIYEKERVVVKLKDIKIKYQHQGINLTKNIKLLNMNYNMENIVSEQFRKEEEINSGVVQNYLGISPRSVNEFNFYISKRIYGVLDMKQISSKYLLHKSNYKKSESHGERAKHKFKMKQVFRNQEKAMQRERDEEYIRKNKQKKRQMRIEVMNSDKHNVVNHIDRKNFHGNFSGFKDMFVQLFGTR